ncbi:MAG TPA: M20/M25/M40 family metallo-hydrolase [Acidimicrobiia bacterium]|nr:M20/M25/M40 family metallo-hydrolase [Acidimicrobiia bacterium]
MAATTVDLLQELIRNRCVNDGSVDSGQEVRSVATLRDFFGVDGEIFEPAPGRQSLVYRVPGSDPDAPTMALVPHLDVVPVNSKGWSVDPFAAEIGDGFVWGRGAIDMLNVTAAMAHAFRPYLTGEASMPGDLVFAAVADEENAGTYGAAPLVDGHWDLVGADFLLTEIAYPSIRGRYGPLYPVAVGEKGPYWTRLTTRGTPGHGSAPYGADNALEPLVEAVDRLFASDQPVSIRQEWRELAASLDLPPEVAAGLVDPDRLDDTIETLAVDDPDLARYAHAVTHLTVSPNLLEGGTKANVIPDRAFVDVDIRALPGMDRDFVDAYLRRAMGDVSDQVELEPLADHDAIVSPSPNPLWDAIVAGIETHTGSGHVVPTMMTGFTDARFWRAKGTVAYGVGLYDDSTDFATFLSLFHGHDERVAIESLKRTTRLLETVLAGFGQRTGS